MNPWLATKTLSVQPFAENCSYFVDKFITTTPISKSTIRIYENHERDSNYFYFTDNSNVIRFCILTGTATLCSIGKTSFCKIQTESGVWIGSQSCFVTFQTNSLYSLILYRLNDNTIDFERNLELKLQGYSKSTLGAIKFSRDYIGIKAAQNFVIWKIKDLLHDGVGKNVVTKMETFAFSRDSNDIYFFLSGEVWKGDLDKIYRSGCFEMCEFINRVKKEDVEYSLLEVTSNYLVFPKYEMEPRLNLMRIKTPKYSQFQMTLMRQEEDGWISLEQDRLLNSNRMFRACRIIGDYVIAFYQLFSNGMGELIFFDCNWPGQHIFSIKNVISFSLENCTVHVIVSQPTNKRGKSVDIMSIYCGLKMNVLKPGQNPDCFWRFI